MSTFREIIQGTQPRQIPAPYSTAWQTDFKRFKEDPLALIIETCIGGGSEELIYKTAWKQYRNVYIRYWDQDDESMYTVHVPHNATITQVCNFIFNFSGEYVIQPGIYAYVDHSETWLLVCSIITFVTIAILYYLSNRKKNKNCTKTPIYIYALLLFVAIYNLVRYLPPQTSGKSWTTVSQFVPIT